MKTMIDSGYEWEIWHNVGETKHRGCQCFKDCNCALEFTPEPYDNYSVIRTGKKHKHTRHATLEEAYKRLEDFTQ